jgi:hypothetical protein
LISAERKAKLLHPLRKVVQRIPEKAGIYEMLECGHSITPRSDAIELRPPFKPQRRRCKKCKPEEQ